MLEQFEKENLKKNSELNSPDRYVPRRQEVEEKELSIDDKKNLKVVPRGEEIAEHDSGQGFLGVPDNQLVHGGMNQETQPLDKLDSIMPTHENQSLTAPPNLGTIQSQNEISIRPLPDPNA